MAAARPVIGLTTYAERARFGVQDTVSAVLPMSYVRAVHREGGRAVLLTPDQADTDMLDGLDGIMFTGGSDIDPQRYGAPPHPTTRVNAARDAAELLLLSAALAADLPVLGVCRGAQLLAVAGGGRLHQHLPEVLGHDRHRPATPPGDPGGGSGPVYGAHRVRLAPGSLGHAVLGAEITVNSFHHQGIADPGRLTPVGWCVEDDLIEVVEDPARRFTLGVQWHPEEDTDPRLFAALVAAAAARRAGSARRAGPGGRAGPAG